MLHKRKGNNIFILLASPAFVSSNSDMGINAPVQSS